MIRTLRPRHAISGMICREVSPRTAICMILIALDITGV